MADDSKIKDISLDTEEGENRLKFSLDKHILGFPIRGVYIQAGHIRLELDNEAGIELKFQGDFKITIVSPPHAEQVEQTWTM